MKILRKTIPRLLLSLFILLALVLPAFTSPVSVSAMTEITSWTSSLVFPHAFIWVDHYSKFFGVNVTGSMKMFSFDPATGNFASLTLSDYGSAAGDMVYNSGNDRFYIACKVAGDIPGIIEVNWGSQTAVERYSGATGLQGRVIKTDGTYLYLFTWGSNSTSDPSQCVRVKISDWSHSELVLTGAIKIEGGSLDGNYYYGSTLGDPSIMTKVDISTTPMTFTNTTLTGFKSSTDDMADGGNGYLYVGSENQTAYLKFKKSDSSFQVITGDGDIPTTCYGAILLNGYIYFVYSGTPGKIMELKIADGTYTILTLSSGLNTPNELATYDGYIYASTYTNPMKIIKIEASTDLIPTTTPTTPLDSYFGAKPVLIVLPSLLLLGLILMSSFIGFQQIKEGQIIAGLLIFTLVFVITGLVLLVGMPILLNGVQATIWYK
jgi:hypothetical protein